MKFDHQAIKIAEKELRAKIDEKKKNQLLLGLTKSIQLNENNILNENKKDLSLLPDNSSHAFRDRLTLNSSRIKAICESLEFISGLKDPIGEIVESKILNNGLNLKKIRAPIGVIFMIFESRPNIAIEAFSLAFKSGNLAILRGGKESTHTCTILYKLIKEQLSLANINTNSFIGITNPDRSIILDLLKKNELIDLVIPRGGSQLIDYVTQNTSIPIIKNDRGMCHVYVHEDANLTMASQIVQNAKSQRPGVCNAMETLLVHSSIADLFIPQIYEIITNTEKSHPVEWFVCSKTKNILKNKNRVSDATLNSFDTEYLDYKMNCKVVDSFESAIEHIQMHGSKHSECIITESNSIAKEFQNEIDAAAVYWNASTRFTDGYEFGLGGEIGISTQKLHVRGPVGLNELTSLRWIIDGQGQVRK